MLVEVFDRCLRLDAETSELVRADVAFALVEVVLVLDLADDLFENVLNGDQAADARVFVDDDRHVVVRDAELTQEHIEALGFRNEDGWMQPVAQIEGAVVANA